MVLFYVTQIKLHRFDGAFTIDTCLTGTRMPCWQS